jgi:hypothetical protein
MGTFGAGKDKSFLLKALSIEAVVGRVLFIYNNVFHRIYGMYVFLSASRVIRCMKGSFLQSKVTSKDSFSGNSSRVSILCEPMKKILLVSLPLISIGSCLPIFTFFPLINFFSYFVGYIANLKIQAFVQ